MGNVAGSDSSVIGAGAAGVKDCLSKHLNGNRNFDLSNKIVIEDFLSREVIRDGAEMGAFVVLS